MWKLGNMGIREFIYRFKYHYGQHLPLKIPVDISLELSSFCNQKCVYCYHADPKKLPFKRGFMDLGLAEKVIMDAAQLGVNSIKFNYRGESTLHPNFRHLTAMARKLAIGSTFIDRLTNSNFKFATDREDIFEGLCNQTKVKVSFDSFQKEIFEKQRDGAKYELAVANVDYFHAMEKRTELVIQAVRTNLNKDEDLKGFVQSRWPGAKLSIRDMVTGRVDSNLKELEPRKKDPLKRKSCLQAHVRLIIGHEGTTTVCCPDIGTKLVVGNAKKDSIEKMFNSDRAKTIRQALLDKSIFTVNPCKNCPSYESYEGFKMPWGS